MAGRLGVNNLVEAVCHLDEAGQPHLHLDFLVITEDNRLSSKNLITRDFITSIHRLLPLILQNHGFDVELYEEADEPKRGGLSAKEYKKAMKQEEKELSQHIDEMVEEYNKLVNGYNRLLTDSHELKNNNKQKAKEILENKEKTR